MILLTPPELSERTQQRLGQLQQDVNTLEDFEQQVALAKAHWENRTSNLAFDEIREKLATMSFGKRCHYCEDSDADEIEHIRPKSLYPGFCFRWENYVYACGPCNGPKNNKFAVFDEDSGELIRLGERANPNAQPPPGEVALINPREDDPMEFLRLDVLETFSFGIISEAGTREYARAHYTRDTLGLNSRSHLVEMREDAFLNYLAKLARYVQCRQLNQPRSVLERWEKGLREGPHRSVWEEMKRGYRERSRALPAEVHQLFALAGEEVLEW